MRATEYTLECYGNLNWLIQIIESNGALEIEKPNLDENRKLLNRDDGNLIDLNTWIPLFLNRTFLLCNIYGHIYKL